MRETIISRWQDFKSSWMSAIYGEEFKLKAKFRLIKIPIKVVWRLDLEDLIEGQVYTIKNFSKKAKDIYGRALHKAKLGVAPIT